MKTVGKNILILVNSLQHGGGAERIAANIGSELVDKGHNVTFLERYEVENRYQFKGELISLYQQSNINYLIKFLRETKTPKTISEISKEKGIDTVISFSGLPNYCSILSKMFFDNESKIIISERCNPLKSKGLKEHILIKYLYPKADKVIVQTKVIQEILRSRFSISNTIVIPNLIDMNKIELKNKNNTPKKNLEELLEDFTFINIGRLSKAKGQWHLLRSFKRVSKKTKCVKLILLGDGDLKINLENLVDELKIKDKVYFLGKVNNVFTYLKKSDCFVFSSLFEGFPNVLTEALSQNLPIVSTDCISGPREILCPNLNFNEKISYPHFGKYGVLTKPFENKIFFKTLQEKPLSQEEKMFSEWMINMYENEDLRKEYSNQTKRAEDYDVSNVIKKWEKLI